MGLDMYLMARNNADEAPDEFDIEVVYWRKANEIHGWFREYCEPVPGKEGCWFVTREDITNLIGTCKDVIEHCFMLNIGDYKDDALIRGGCEDYAAEHLPTCDGFFFGSTDYDSWYARSVVRTVAELEHALATCGDDIFMYEASW